MKRISKFLIVPAIALLAACSSSTGSTGTGTGKGNPSSSGGSGSNGGGTTNGGGGNNNNGGGGDDAGDPGTTTQQYDVALAGAAEFPAVASTANGSGKFTLGDDGVTLKFDITNTVQNPTSVALHLGFPGEAGAVIHPLDNPSGHMTGQVTLTADEATALTSGQIYLEIQSAAHPSGELRGTLATPGSEIFVAKLTGSQVVPEVTTQSNGHASFILNGTKDTVRYHVVTSATPTDAHINKAIGSLNGPTAFPFSGIAQTMDGSLTLTANDAADLEDGHWYVEIITAAHATGELRGQAVREGEELFTAILSGANEVPPVTTSATGGAQVIVGADRASVRYEIVVNGVIPTGADIDNAPKGKTGSMLYPLSLNQTGAKGNVNVSASDLSSMTAANLAINVETASNTSGELRGQIIAR